MATSEERMKILKMIQEGKITASEGAELLEALEFKTGKGGCACPGVCTSLASHFDARAALVSRGGH